MAQPPKEDCLLLASVRRFNPHALSVYNLYLNRYSKVERDSTVTFDSLMEVFRGKPIMSRWHDLGKQLHFPSQKLRAISSMEELLKCYTTDHCFNLKWSDVRDALNRMGEQRLASDVYIGYMLPKQTRKFLTSMHAYN